MVSAAVRHDRIMPLITKEASRLHQMIDSRVIRKLVFEARRTQSPFDLCDAPARLPAPQSRWLANSKELSPFQIDLGITFAVEKNHEHRRAC
jgi:hypothetical protein